MNREIKFRAWVLPDEFGLIPEPYMAVQGEPDLETLQSFMHHYGDCENLMQFTGLLDKNGKEIYEGDILKYTYQDVMEIEGVGKCNYRVAFQDGAFGWMGNITNSFFSFAAEPLDNCEIIGNVFENPELLNP
jgi:uncharacterized phage protein (TIGR01671 family)